jgi:thiamine pyrophosphate-dependent acetolactate synthase large subunit-like protein
MTGPANQRSDLDRRAVVAALLADRGDLLVVSGLGSTTWDVAAAGDHDRNFYLWGAMGGAAMIGLGLALARQEVPVVVITGDGEQLMGLGGLATIGVHNPANLAVVVIDNQRYGETGMQLTHTAHGVDLPAIATAAGFRWAEAVTDMAGVHALANRIKSHEGAGFASVLVSEVDHDRVLPPRDGVYLKTRVREALGMRLDEGLA